MYRHTRMQEGEAPAGTTAAPSDQERFESSRVGRLLISVFIIVTLFAIMVWNMPDSQVRNLAMPAVRPYMRVTGLSQTWALFAPNIRDRSRETVARIEYADGSTDSWRPPGGELILEPYRTYRWRKWGSIAHLEEYEEFWQPTAAWVAEHHDHRGRTPVTVELIRRWRDLGPAGRAEPKKVDEWKEVIYYTLDMGAEGQGPA